MTLYFRLILHWIRLHWREDEYDSYPFPKLPSQLHTVLVYHKLSLLLSLSPSYQVIPCDTLPEILYDNVSAKHNDILFEHLLYSYNHNTSEFTLWQATGNSQVKFSLAHSYYILLKSAIMQLFYSRKQAQRIICLKLKR